MWALRRVFTPKDKPNIPIFVIAGVFGAGRAA
jgi:hypothetical protein